MSKLLTPDEAAVEINNEAAENIKLYRSMYERYMKSIAIGGHGSCCERQTCYRAMEEDSLIRDMNNRIHPRYWHG